MKPKNIALAVAAGFLLMAAVLPLPHPARAQGGPNLLTNPSFEGGWYDVQIGQVPNAWEWHWLDNVTFPGSDRPALRPESRVLSKDLMPPQEHSLYFLDGEYVIKIFKPQAPIYVALSQNVNNLEVGRRYRLVAHVFPDLFDWDGQKIPPTDPYAAQIRLGAGPTGAQWLDTSAIAYGEWVNGTMYSSYYLSYVEVEYEFVATAAQMTVWIEMAAKWGLDNNGFFLDDTGLYPLELVSTPTNTPAPLPPTNTPGPPPTPRNTPTPRPDGAIVHIVQPGDTLYGIAIEYGVPVEQIEALNVGSIPPNKWLTTGQELVIAIPGTAPTAVPPTQPAEAGTPVPTAETTEPAPAGGGSVCVLAYHDRNGDTFRQEETEERLPNAVITLADMSGVVGQYTTDALSEPYCFADLPAGTYRVAMEPPPGYINSGASEVYLALGEDGTLDVALGAQRGEAAPTAEAGEEPGAEPGAGGGLLGSSALHWAARIAGILMLAAAVAAAVLFFLSRSRR